MDTWNARLTFWHIHNFYRSQSTGRMKFHSFKTHDMTKSPKTSNFFTITYHIHFPTNYIVDENFKLETLHVEPNHAVTWIAKDKKDFFGQKLGCTSRGSIWKYIERQSRFQYWNCNPPVTFMLNGDYECKFCWYFSLLTCLHTLLNSLLFFLPQLSISRSLSLSLSLYYGSGCKKKGMCFPHLHTNIRNSPAPRKEVKKTTVRPPPKAIRILTRLHTKIAVYT